MKKLKIFLLLSILLCFGFTLSSEVHAQSTGPKPFEVGDVLPATTRLRVYWDSTIVSQMTSTKTIIGNDFNGSSYYQPIFGILIEDDDGILSMFIWLGVRSSLNFSFAEYTYLDGWQAPYTAEGGGHNYIDIDISTIPIEGRTMKDVDITGMSWEDLNAPSAKPFEVNDVLPAGYIKISWDFTDIPIPDKAVTFGVSSGDDVFNDLIIEIDFNFGGYDHLKIFNGGSVEHFNVDTPGFTVITLTESVTITDLGGSDGITSLDYNVYIGDALTWEVISQDYLNGFIEAREIYGFRYMGGPWMSGEAAWNHGYDKGSEETWEEGFEYGMEIGMEEYGYYDPITDQWLSVTEYINLYGTDKMNQSDFYNNFDKYFIPAMIIVFGGAIVLTILKVFKGRE